MSGRGRQLLGALLFAAAMVPLVGSLDLLADRRVVTALIGLLAGGLLAAAGARVMLGPSRGGGDTTAGRERRRAG